MTRDEIAAMFARRQAAFDDMDAQALAADYADDAVIESPTAGTHHGPEAAAQAFEHIFRAFADHTRTTETLVVDGNHVAEVLAIEGTNLGGLMGLPHGSRHHRVRAVLRYELERAKIIRHPRPDDVTCMLVLM